MRVELQHRNVRARRALIATLTATFDVPFWIAVTMPLATLAPKPELISK